LQKKQIVFYLILISCISLGFKLYTVDFSVSPDEDTYNYVLRAIGHNNGDFSEHPRKTLGWSIVISPFLHLVDSNNFIDYINVARYLGISISIISIYPMYLLARKFFDDKYSLCASSFFAFEPHLNHLSSEGYSEPIYILVIILTLFFILNKNLNYSYLSFFSVAVLWYMRWSGIVIFAALTVIFFLNNKKNSKLLLKYFLCVGIFLVLVSPMLLQRYEQFGDPMYFSQSSTLFIGNPIALLADNTQNIEYSASDYIDENGITKFLYTFVTLGIYNILVSMVKLSFPFLIVFLPFGILFSLRAFDQDKNYLRSNWIIILITIASMVYYFGVWPDKRLLFQIFPFLIILCTIPLQRIVTYGLGTFSFSEKQKNLFLVGVIAIIILLSGLFTLRFESPDPVLDSEKTEFAEILTEKLDGKILDTGDTLQGLVNVKLANPPGVFKNAIVNQDINLFHDSGQKLVAINIYATTMDDFIKTSKEYDLKYVSFNQNAGDFEPWYPYLADVYENEEKFPYLIKVFDTEQEEFEKLKAKVFEIDYKIYYEING